jgi:hypothetical protein
VKQDETAKILKPTKVRLVYKDTPILAALQDLRKKTGVGIDLIDNRQIVVQRKITLDTGETSFWQAFDQFCAKAGLVEADLVGRSSQARTSAMNDDAARERLIQQQRLRRLQMRGSIGRYQPAGVDPGRLVLTDGKSPVLATSYLGAVRVQVIAGNTPGLVSGQGASAGNGARKTKGLPFVGLVVKPEPRMQWYQLQHLAISLARDENNHILKGARVRDPRPQPDPDMEVYYASRLSTLGGIPLDGLPLVVRLGDHPVKGVKELRGKFEAGVQSPPRALLTIENILKAKGKIAGNDDGSTVKILDVHRQEDGSVRVCLEVSSDSRTGLRRVRGLRVRRIGGTVAWGGSAMTSGGQFELLDAKGNRFLRSGMAFQQLNLNGNTLTQGIDLTFQPGKNQAKAAKLVLTGSRPTIITVPFTLKDIKLP